jgi:hypothetical protein
LVDRLAVGDEVVVQAFRTDALKPDHYIATAVTVDGQVVALRDESLRPNWAGGRVRGQGGGRGPCGMGGGVRWGCGRRGMGPGNASASLADPSQGVVNSRSGRGFGQGPPPSGWQRGYGYGRRDAGPGPSYGPGRGRGAGVAPRW